MSTALALGEATYTRDALRASLVEAAREACERVNDYELNEVVADIVGNADYVTLSARDYSVLVAAFLAEQSFINHLSRVAFTRARNAWK